MTMHRSFLVASVLLLILSGHSEFLDMNPDFDPPLQLFPSNDFIDDQSEVSSNLDDLPYSYFFAGAGDCASASNGSPSRVRARNNACPVVDDEGIPKRPTTYREKVINQLMAPLDPLDETGETAEKNYVNGFCLDSTIDRRAIPVCTSGFESDVYLNAFGGVTLRNCELLSLKNMYSCLHPKSITCCAEFEVVTPMLLVLPGGPFLQDTYSWGTDCTNF